MLLIVPKVTLCHGTGVESIAVSAGTLGLLVPRLLSESSEIPLSSRPRLRGDNREISRLYSDTELAAGKRSGLRFRSERDGPVGLQKLRHRAEAISVSRCGELGGGKRAEGVVRGGTEAFRDHAASISTMRRKHAGYYLLLLRRAQSGRRRGIRYAARMSDACQRARRS